MLISKRTAELSRDITKTLDIEGGLAIIECRDRY